MSGKKSWERVTPDGLTQRLSVHSGWVLAVYGEQTHNGELTHYTSIKLASTCFIPDHEHQWELDK